MTSTTTPSILSGAWWKAAALRALRTAIVIAVPYFGGGTLLHIPWATAAGAVVLGAIASLATSLVGLPELSDAGTPIGLALLERVVKTAGQSIVAGIGSAAIFSDVHWSVVLQATVVASIGSLFIGVLGYLPESTLPVANAIVNIAPSSEADLAQLIDYRLRAQNAPTDPDQPAAGVPPVAAS